MEQFRTTPALPSGERAIPAWLKSAFLSTLVLAACWGGVIVYWRNTAAPKVAMLIADTGHRSSRVLELMGHVSADLPQLDETDEVLRVGVASGSCGAVPFMTALALGRHYVVERGTPVLCISNEDALHYMAVPVRPVA